MPIRPENKQLYPPNAEWAALRERILAQQGNRCEFCNVPNGMKIARAVRDPKSWIEYLDGDEWLEERNVLTVVLTVAHLNHDPADNRDCNLAALCQRCHNRLDAPMRSAGRMRRKEEKK